LLTAPHEVTIAWSIIALATAGVVTRPFRLSEAVWAVAGAVALVLLGFLPWGDALNGIRRGIDVYLFLTGMMLIAELARQEGLFDYLAALAVEHARGSPQRLFLLIYLVGTAVTVLLSNDATAIALTPAVYAATRAAGAAPCPIFSSAPLSPMPRVSCSRSRTPPISSCSVSACRISSNGYASSPCLRWRRSLLPMSCCA
jgi:arsenical pump membrane protein